MTSTRYQLPEAMIDTLSFFLILVLQLGYLVSLQLYTEPLDSMHYWINLPLRESSADMSEKLFFIDSTLAKFLGNLIQLMHTTMVPEQVKTMKIQAGVQVSKPGELRRHLQLWKRFGRHYFIVIVLVRNIVFSEIRYSWKPTVRTFIIVINKCSLTRITSTKVVPTKETSTKSVATPTQGILVYSRRPKAIEVLDSTILTLTLLKESKDEVPEFVIKFLKMIQVRLNATVRNIRTDNGTDFVNQTLKAYYEEVEISHQTSVA
ncbi:retrovirus-related pol polyprotein from transposon TNT 1-94 [Tanacetum coccineum]